MPLPCGRTRGGDYSPVHAGILPWGEFREQFNEGLDAGNVPATRLANAMPVRRGVPERRPTPRKSIGRFTVVNCLPRFAFERSISHSSSACSASFYTRYMLVIAGLGGLLYGIDIGIISAALLYLNKTINLSVQQTSFIVAAVLGGSMLSSPIAGFIADWIGRKRMMIAGGLLFVASVGIMVLSQDFVSLFIGRLLQGISGGVIAVAVPLFLAESLSAATRGRGTGFFQLMLTVGIVLAALAGFFYTHQAEVAIAAAHGDSVRVLAAENHAWRGMFLAVVYPGLLFFIGFFFLSETPRWLFRKGRGEAALASLRRSVGESEAQREMREMQTLASSVSPNKAEGTATSSLLQRRYVIPFLLACAILGLNQTTGISTLLGFLVIILRQAGMSASHATAGDVVVKLINIVMTVIGVALIDRKGRRFLLKLGTGAVVLSLVVVAVSFYSFESKRVDVTGMIQRSIVHDSISMPMDAIFSSTSVSEPKAVTVIFNVEKVITPKLSSAQTLTRFFTSMLLRVTHLPSGAR